MRLIGENGEQLGIVPLAKALQIATEAGLDDHRQPVAVGARDGMRQQRR